MIFALLLAAQTMPEAGGGKTPTLSADAGESSVEITITHAGSGEVVAVAADPLAGCSFHGPASREQVLQLLAVSVGARVAEMTHDASYAVVRCDTVRFDGAASAVWPIGEDPPPEVIEILVHSAVARLTIAAPTPLTAPDGLDTPFLVHLPVWLWTSEAQWQRQTATASLGALGLSATAAATPSHMIWTPGDGSPDTTCTGPGIPWTATAGNDDNTSCRHTYTSITAPEETLSLRVTAVFDLAISCAPTRLCDRVELPSTLQAQGGRTIRVAQARGILTG